MYAVDFMKFTGLGLVWRPQYARNTSTPNAILSLQKSITVAHRCSAA